MFAFVNEKTVNGVTYTAYRSTDNPKDVKVVLSTGEEVYPDNFKKYWEAL